MDILSFVILCTYYVIKKYFDIKKLLFVYVVLYLTFICSLLFSYIIFEKNAEIKTNQIKSKIYSYP